MGGGGGRLEELEVLIKQPGLRASGVQIRRRSVLEEGRKGEESSKTKTWRVSLYEGMRDTQEGEKDRVMEREKESWEEKE